jgi:mono/diheme cytochrome c family protein|nr:MAG: hypothetical protein DIU62_02335 [Pseudomonadota bacterium]
MRHGFPPRCAWLLLLLAAPLARAADAPAPGARGLWLRHCGPCHLQGGTGTFMLGRRLGQERALLEERTDLTAEYVRTVVRHGIQSMPRFSRAELPDAELEQIARFLSAPKAP